MAKPPSDPTLAILKSLREPPPLFYGPTTLPAGVFLTLAQAELIIPVLLKHFPAAKVEELFSHKLAAGTISYLEMATLFKAAIAGKEVYITKKECYPILYRGFPRFKKENRELVGKRRISLSQVNSNKWRIVMMSSQSKDRPPVQFEEGFTRKHGRYRQWATALKENSIFQSGNESDVKKVMAAWRLYVPLEERKDLRLVRQKVSNSWSVFVLPKAG